MDVKTAFLNAPIDIEPDVILPDGFATGGNDEQFNSFEGRRRRALTAIPGCPQGSRVWRQKIVGVLNRLGFSTFLPDEPCLFKDAHADPIILVLWVDDIIESAPTTAATRSSDLHDRLRAHFPHGAKISDDDARVFHLLGCVVERPRPDFIRMHQKPFLRQLLYKAGFVDGKSKGMTFLLHQLRTPQRQGGP